MWTKRYARRRGGKGLVRHRVVPADRSMNVGVAKLSNLLLHLISPQLPNKCDLLGKVI